MTTLHVQGMQCAHCAATAKKSLEELGATQVEIDLAAGEVRFEGHLDVQAACEAITAKGFAVIDSGRS